MNEEIICRWNKVVREDDTVYHLGDVAFMSFDNIRAVLRRLNGRKILIRGNHDRKPDRMSEAGFELVVGQAWYQGWRMAHIPWPISHHEKGLCGHVHEKWLRYRNLINVGTDQWNFYPVTLEKLQTAVPDKLKIEPWDTTAGHERPSVT